MVAEANQVEEPSSVVAEYIRVWHLRDASVQVQLRANTHRWSLCQPTTVSEAYIILTESAECRSNVIKPKRRNTQGSNIVVTAASCKE